MTDMNAQLDALREQTRQLAKQLDQLQAKDQIASRIRNVARGLDRLDRELLLAQFHADAEVDYGKIYRGGAAGFVEVALQFQGAMRDTQHIVGNIEITVQGEEAVAESYVYAHHVLQAGEQLMELIVGGRYLDRFTRRDGEWRISHRTELLDWGRNVPITEGWFDDNAELAKGRRDRQDRSYELFARR